MNGRDESNVNTPARRVAIVGSHGVGKTTLAVDTLNCLAAENIPAQLAPEMPRFICSLVPDGSFFRRGHNTVLRQLLLIYSQTQTEFDRSQHGSGIIICDRSVIDHWAYTKLLFADALEHDGVLALYEHFILNFCRTYEQLFYIPIENPPADDGVREDDQEFQQAIDHIIVSCLKKFELPYFEVRGTPAERCDIVVSKIRDAMKQSSAE